MDFEKFNKALTTENKKQFDQISKTNLHAHALLSSNIHNFQTEFHRTINNNCGFSNFVDFDNCIKTNLSDLIKNRDTQLKLYELSIITAIDDGVTVLDISVDYRSVNRIFNGLKEKYIVSLKKLKNKYKNRINLNFDLAINREGFHKTDFKLIKDLINTEFFHGIDLVGDEKSNKVSMFKKIYNYAGKKKLVLKAHVGEYGTAKDIKKAIKILNLQMVQHGIAIVQSEQIMKFAKKRKIIFNVCISSNLMLLKNIELDNHPIRKMYDYGLNVTLNTDDELIFNSSLFHEYLLLYKCGLFNTEELFEVLNNGLNAVNV